jgi:DnaD/phage-associated family protein
MYKPVVVSPEGIEKLAAAGNGTAALLLLHIHGGGGMRAAPAAIQASERDVAEAAALLTSLGLLPGGIITDGDPPSYTSAELTEALNSREFKSLADETERRLGRKLPMCDLVILFELYDWLALPPGVISLLISHGTEEAKERYGPGRMPTLRTLRRIALDWTREGLRTVMAAETYLEALHNRRKTSAKMARALQIIGRELSPSESKYIGEWQSMGFDEHAVALVYDKAVIATGKRAWNYMDKILQRWHAAGLHTPEEIAAGDARPQGSAGKDGKPLSRIEREAMERLRGGEG